MTWWTVSHTPISPCGQHYQRIKYLFFCIMQCVSSLCPPQTQVHIHGWHDLSKRPPKAIDPDYVYHSTTSKYWESCCAERQNRQLLLWGSPRFVGMPAVQTLPPTNSQVASLHRNGVQEPQIAFAVSHVVASQSKHCRSNWRNNFLWGPTYKFKYLQPPKTYG